MKQAKNLDLDSYKPFINEFYKYSGDIFDFDSSVFQ